jgi:hypothetical protein
MLGGSSAPQPIVSDSSTRYIYQPAPLGEEVPFKDGLYHDHGHADGPIHSNHSTDRDHLDRANHPNHMGFVDGTNHPTHPNGIDESGLDGKRKNLITPITLITAITRIALKVLMVLITLITLMVLIT